MFALLESNLTADISVRISESLKPEPVNGTSVTNSSRYLKFNNVKEITLLVFNLAFVALGWLLGYLHLIHVRLIQLVEEPCFKRCSGLRVFLLNLGEAFVNQLNQQYQFIVVKTNRSTVIVAPLSDLQDVAM